MVVSNRRGEETFDSVLDFASDPAIFSVPVGESQKALVVEVTQ